MIKIVQIVDLICPIVVNLSWVALLGSDVCWLLKRLKINVAYLCFLPLQTNLLEKSPFVIVVLLSLQVHSTVPWLAAIGSSDLNILEWNSGNRWPTIAFNELQ